MGPPEFGLVARALEKRCNDVVHEARGEARGATVRIVARCQFRDFGEHHLRVRPAVPRPVEQVAQQRESHVGGEPPGGGGADPGGAGRGMTGAP